MAYDLEEVADYAQKIAKECADVNFAPNDNWSNLKEVLNTYQQNFRKEKSKFTLMHFATAIKNASNHLKDTKANQEVIDPYVLQLNKGYRELFPQSKLKMPLPALMPTPKKGMEIVRSWFSTTTAKASEITTMLNSEPFKELDNYLHQVLNEDERDHRYFCLGDYSEPKKLAVLNQLVTDLKSMQTKDELIQFLTDFYSQKGVAQPYTPETGRRSRYDILNTGQNLTTYYFSFFGVQTTTIDLIDKLALSVNFDFKKAGAQSCFPIEFPSFF